MKLWDYVEKLIYPQSSTIETVIYPQAERLARLFIYQYLWMSFTDSTASTTMTIHVIFSA